MTQAQFRQIILPLKNKLYRFALSYLDSEADAKDVVQDVMLKAWEYIQNPAEFGSPEAWCMTLTRNKSLDRLKKKGRTYLPIEEQYDLQTEEIDPHSETEQKESLDKLQEIIATLPEKQKAVIQLRDVEGYSYKEIAEIMNIGMSQVKVLLHRARKQVQKRFIRINHYGITFPQ